MDDIEKSISHLLPLPRPYPQSLISAASSIRDVSRSKFPLQGDEEPSRAWFASWVAIERYFFSSFLYSLITTNSSSLGTTLSLKKPTLHPKAPITIPRAKFMKLLGNFKSAVPEPILTTPNKTSSQSRVSNADTVSNEISKLCSKVETDVSQAYFAKTLEALLARHTRKESFHVMLAAMFLAISTRKDGGQKKISAGDRKKVIDAFDERFSSKELTHWMVIVEKDFDEMEWFVGNPVMRKTVETQQRKRKGQVAGTDEDGEPVWKRSKVKNFTGI